MRLARVISSWEIYLPAMHMHMARLLVQAQTHMRTHTTCILTLHLHHLLPSELPRPQRPPRRQQHPLHRCMWR